eukprot:jgi/Chlat1/3829/Chrsp26S04048
MRGCCLAASLPLRLALKPPLRRGDAGVLRRRALPPPLSSSPSCHVASASSHLHAQTSASPSSSSSSSSSRPELWLYSTSSRSKERFVEETPGKVSMYVCGVTAYDYSHIGHARVYVAFDVLFRLLLHLGYDVKYARNFTDVDDKIIARARQLGEESNALAERFINEFHADMAALGCLPPTSEPRVTAHIPDIIDMIENIIKRGHAYTQGGDVYFDVKSFAEYGQLSGRGGEVEAATGRARVEADARKRDPADFALWKSAKPLEPSWDSPWGPGRPGWHIECSAMIARVLGDRIDIHGGGADLIFPHHENEIAQSKAACSHAHVGYWLHNGFVTVDDTKMSKSLGNFQTIRQVLSNYHPFALRWLLVGTHYRAPIQFSANLMDMASQRIYAVYQALDDVSHHPNNTSNSAEHADAEADALRNTVLTALCDDMATPSAVAALSEPLRIVNELLYTKKGRKTKGREQLLAAWGAAIQDSLQLLGFDAQHPDRVLQELKSMALVRAKMTEEEIQTLVAERKAARVNKEYGRADEIRRSLEMRGIALMDLGEVTSWQPTAPQLSQEPAHIAKSIKRSQGKRARHYGLGMDLLLTLDLADTCVLSLNLFQASRQLMARLPVFFSPPSTDVLGFALWMFAAAPNSNAPAASSALSDGPQRRVPDVGLYGLRLISISASAPCCPSVGRNQ